MSTTPAPSTASRADAHALDDDAARPDEGAVLDHDGRGLQRLEHPADADAAGEVHVGADLRARPDGRPRVDHRAGADPRADVHVARHQHDARRQVRAVARGRRRHDAHAERLVPVLERQLVVVLERGRPRSPRAPARGSRAAPPASPSARTLPAVALGLGHAHLAPVEHRDHRLDRLRVDRRRRVGRRPPATIASMRCLEGSRCRSRRHLREHGLEARGGPLALRRRSAPSRSARSPPPPGRRTIRARRRTSARSSSSSAHPSEGRPPGTATHR